MSYRRAFWLLLLGTTLARLLIIGSFGFSTDEGHYAMYARHLAWGYFDHPPLVAAMAATTTFFGESLFAWRLGPVLCWAGALVLVRELALALYRDERVAFWSALLFLCMPLSHLLAVGLLPDAPLGLFWCAGLLMTWYGLSTGRWLPWLLAGVLFGAALLSKYHGILLPACVVLYLLVSPEERHWLRRPQPWVAAAIGLLVFAPNVIWNAQHDWISYGFQAGQGAGLSVDPSRLLTNAAGQLGAASPILFGLLIAAWVVLLRRGPLSRADRYVLCTSLGVFGFFLVAGLFGKLLPHWTAVGWFTGAIAVTGSVPRLLADDAAATRRWQRWLRAGGALGLALVAVVYLGLARPIVGPLYEQVRATGLLKMEPFHAGLDPTNALYGWRETAQRIETLRGAMPDPDRTFVFTHRFLAASNLGPFLDRDTVVTTLYRKPSQYRIWFDPAAHLGSDALYVNVGRFQKEPESYAPLFESLAPEVEHFTVERHGWPASEVEIYRFYGFKGEIARSR